MAGVASVAGSEIEVHRLVRVAILNTGDELIPPGQPAEPWQIRDSNGPTLDAALQSQPWIEVVRRQRVKDDLQAIAEVLQSLADVDAVLLTGGVSMGDTDHVPAAIEASGGQIVFHRFAHSTWQTGPRRSPRSTVVVGLPANPVSVAVTARLIAMPLLRCRCLSERLGGLTEMCREHVGWKSRMLMIKNWRCIGTGWFGWRAMAAFDTWTTVVREI